MHKSISGCQKEWPLKSDAKIWPSQVCKVFKNGSVLNFLNCSIFFLIVDAKNADTVFYLASLYYAPSLKSYGHNHARETSSLVSNEVQPQLPIGHHSK